ncbi:hypothetical protein [Desulfotomaculum defluvii]
MARINDSIKQNMGFWLTDAGEIQYHPKCARCKHQCKQSFRCIKVICPKYERR